MVVAMTILLHGCQLLPPPSSLVDLEALVKKQLEITNHSIMYSCGITKSLYYLCVAGERVIMTIRP